MHKAARTTKPEKVMKQTKQYTTSTRSAKTANCIVQFAVCSLNCVGYESLQLERKTAFHAVCSLQFKLHGLGPP